MLFAARSKDTLAMSREEYSTVTRFTPTWSRGWFRVKIHGTVRGLIDKTLSLEIYSASRFPSTNFFLNQVVSILATT